MIYKCNKHKPKSIVIMPKIGFKHSEKSKNRMSLKRSGSGNAMYNKHHSISTKTKMRVVKIGKYLGRDNPNYGKRGPDSPHFIGIRVIDDDGYFRVYKPDHPHADKRGRVLEHRLIYEEHYKCCILRYIHVHHVNDNRLDNRIENLMLVTASQHNKLRKPKTKP